MPVESLDPAHTALVLVDLQRGVVSRDVAPHPADTVLDNALAMAEAFRAAGAPVVLVRTTAAAGDRPLVDAAVPVRRASRASEEVVEELRDLGDVLVTKQTWGAFHDTDLDEQLRSREVDTVVLAGIATNTGVESTARAAHEHGYSVVVAEDACSSLDAAMHEFAVARVFPLVSRVTTSARVVQALGSPPA